MSLKLHFIYYYIIFISRENGFFVHIGMCIICSRLQRLNVSASFSKISLKKFYLKFVGIITSIELTTFILKSI